MNNRADQLAAKLRAELPPLPSERSDFDVALDMVRALSAHIVQTESWLDDPDMNDDVSLQPNSIPEEDGGAWGSNLFEARRRLYQARQAVGNYALLLAERAREEATS